LKARETRENTPVDAPAVIALLAAGGIAAWLVKRRDR